MSRSTDEDEFVCILGGHLKNPNRNTLMTFNTRCEEKVIAEINFHPSSAMACLNGKKMLSLPRQFH